MKKEKKRPHPGRPASKPNHPLYQLFEERGIDKWAFAQAMDITRNHLDGILAGRKRPSAPLALQMSKLLGVSLEDILFPKVKEAKEEPKHQDKVEARA